jgi:hypothetical protein
MSLKPSGRRSDVPGMFATLAPGSGAGRGRLRALRLSLNTPVVAIEHLPVGPAAAGIALHEVAEGFSLTLALRSVRGGQLVLFRPEEGWGELHGPELALDAALSFAESMGFLFDEDALAAGGDARDAARSWADLVQDAEFDADAVEDEDDLWLEDLVPAASGPLLTKFRLFRAGGDRGAAPAPPAATAGDVWIDLLSRF